MGAVEKDYRFDTEDGTKTLADLFDGRSQLIAYHFMFGPSWNAGCPACSSIADTLAPQVPHLKARDTTLLPASRAPLQKLLAYRERMEWPIDWVSSGGSDFNRDLGLFSTAEELQPFLEGDIPVTVELYARMCGTDPGGYVAEGPGISVYALSDGTRLPHLRNNYRRHRAGNCLLHAVGPHAERSSGERYGATVDPPPRRIRPDPRPCGPRMTPFMAPRPTWTDRGDSGGCCARVAVDVPLARIGSMMRELDSRTRDGIHVRLLGSSTTRWKRWRSATPNR